MNRIFTVEIPASWRESIADPCTITLKITRKDISALDILHAVVSKYDHLKEIIFANSTQLRANVSVVLKTGNGNPVGIVCSSEDLQSPVDERYVTLVLSNA